MRVLGLILLMSQVAFSSVLVTGKVFKKGETDKQIMSVQRTAVKNEGLQTSTVIFKNMEGKTALTETVTFDSDVKFSDFKIENNQLDYVGNIKREKETVKFDLTKEKKKKGTKTETNKKPVLVGSLLSLFVNKNWKRLMAGESIDIRLAIADRQDTIGFTLKKVDGKSYNGKTYTTIEMRPTSWAVRLAVKNIYMSFDDSALLRVYEGRLTVKEEVDGKYKDLDATVFYDYQKIAKK